MRVLVTGSRHFANSPVVSRALHLAQLDLDDDGQITVVHGGARGADSIAGRLAETNGWAVEFYRADWDRYGRSAGHRRNAEMVAAGADVCLAFLQSTAENRGTRGCVKLALAAGIPVRAHDETGPLPTIPEAVTR